LGFGRLAGDRAVGAAASGRLVGWAAAGAVAAGPWIIYMEITAAAAEKGSLPPRKNGPCHRMCRACGLANKLPF
jgi:hypothetical protein